MSLLGVEYFDMYPLPNAGAPGAITSNYTSAPVKRFRSDTYDGRVDQHFNDKNTLYGRYTHNGENTLNPNGFPNVTLNPAATTVAGVATGGNLVVTPVVLQYAGPNDEQQNALAFSFVHVYNPNLLLNLKAGAFRSAIISNPANNGTDVTNKLGIPCTVTACVNAESITKGIVGSGLSTDTVSGLNSAGALTSIGDTSFIPLLEFDTTFQYMGQLTWNHNAHSVRVGLSLIRRRATIGQSSNPQGTFTFNGSYTGVAPGDLLEGLNSGLSRNNTLDQPGFRTWEPSIFVQDDYRVRPWLTLNLGLRYDIFSAYTEVHGRMSNYDPYTGLVESPAIPGIQQSNNTAGVPTPLSDFAPRFGFAATLKHNFVLRGGFGLTYFPVNYESPYYMKNAPFGYSASCSLQNGNNNGNPCSTAAFNGPAGQFGNGLNSSYGVPQGNGGTYNEPGGSLFQLGLPTPVLNIALATNTANYPNTGGIGSVPVNLQENYLEQFNLQVQKQIGANVIQVGYVGQRGVHVAPLNSATNQDLPENPVQNLPGGTLLPMVVGGSSYAFGQLAGYPYFKSGASVSEEANIGTSLYSALQASLVRRFSHGLTTNVNYVWSHMTDNVDGSRACILSIFSTPEPCFYDAAKGAGPVGPVIAGQFSGGASPFFNNNNPAIPGLVPTTQNSCAAAGSAVCTNVFGWQQGDWGNGAQDVRDRITWGLNYELPFGKSMTGVEGVLVKGWALNTSGSWQTGLPFSVTPSNNLGGISGGGYMDELCNPHKSGGNILDWYNYNCFAQPTPGTLGKQAPNQLFGPAQKQVGMSLAKEIPIKENVRLQFRTEVFNLFNQVNLNTPSGTSIAYNHANGTGVANAGGPVQITAPGGSHTTGEITALNANWNPRQIQFALKLLF
jgi:hypothetical protein